MAQGCYCRRMGRGSYAEWTVDLSTGLASRDADVIQFDAGSQRSISIAFVAGGDCSLDEQCLIAGEAAFAIWKAIGKASE